MEEAIHSKRIHHQLLPMEVIYEDGFDEEIVEGLRMKEHNVTKDNPVIGFTAVTAISRARGFIEAMYDPRRFGSIEINEISSNE